MTSAPRKAPIFKRAHASRRSHHRLHRGEAREKKPLEIVKTQVEANKGGFARHLIGILGAPGLCSSAAKSMDKVAGPYGVTKYGFAEKYVFRR